MSEHVREFISGGLAEAVARIVLHPVETIKVRRQMRNVLKISKR